MVIPTVTDRSPVIALQSESWTVCWAPRMPWSGSWRRSASHWESNWKRWQKTAGHYFFFYIHLCNQLITVFPLCLNIHSPNYVVVFFQSFWLSSWHANSSWLNLLVQIYTASLLQLFIHSLGWLSPLSVGHSCHHFMKHRPSRLFRAIVSTYYILLSSLTCFLVNLMLQ